MNLLEFADIKLKQKKILFEQLRSLNKKTKSGRSLLKIHSKWVDEVIQEFYKNFSQNTQNCIVALGGYGRNQLNPYSDIDLMILYTKLDNSIEKLSKDLSDLLYKLGYDTSVIVRTPKDCFELSKKDDTIKTSLMDSKYICGNQKLFLRYEFILKKIIEMDKVSYVKTKIESYQIRHAKYGNTVFVLEPNIKEGVGGLRDYHSVVWIYKAIFNTKNALDMKKHNLMTDFDYEILTSALYFLWRLRNAMHFVANGKNDILYLNLREAIASEMQIYASSYFSAQERLMRKYYYYARKMQDVCEKLINKAAIYISENKNPVVFEIDSKTKVVNNHLEFYDDLNLYNILILFYYSVRYCVNLSFDTIYSINTTNISNQKNDPFTFKLFRLIFSYPKPIYKQIYQMHKSNLLNKLIPEFGKIYCLSEYSMYHKYTVDEHSLQALYFLDKLFEKKTDSPFIMRLQHIFLSLNERDLFLLRFAVLLHDIGKLKKQKHEVLGAEMSLKISDRFGLGKELKQDLYFLIKNHLLLNRVISYQDIDDTKTVLNVLNTVKDKRMLNLLVLLTYADMNAVNDNVWSKWKEQLLETLYIRLILSLEKKDQNFLILTDAKKKKKNLLNQIQEKDILDFLNRIPESLIFDMDEQTILQLLKTFSKPQKNNYFMVEQKDEYARLFVLAKEKIGLINKIAGIMLCANASIILGKTYTLDKNNTIVVFTTKNKNLDENYIEELFLKSEEDESFLDECARKNTNKFLNRLEKTKIEMSIKRIEVEVDNNQSDIYTVVRIHAPDKLGLLYDITKVFKDLEIFIGSIIIDTKGEVAVDTFYVLSSGFKKIYDSKFIDLLKARLYEILS
ncbi:UTP--GlnB (protein PII) uridylyltransferase, GlnD [Desulfurella multipotens]|uniref:Bifunctional uridylyltransferase/uridylyl-removing enzyme n=1 Tax=Desulfurella multipotens TaxID=79269 RepID=A0A1G6R167_9BACT|nr:HD domain-containing protein [Desulfurella multipotens]SDC98420.1 UTP--GlnB (protein PII) uridylyltransferase, GlnD [Desulfurella multipotens]